jgi:outer membrane murein-binding lipoprotein Lpp
MEHHVRRFSIVFIIFSFSCLFTLQSIYAQTTRKRRPNVPRSSPPVKAQKTLTELLQQKATLEVRKGRLMEGLRKLAVEYYGGAENVANSFADLATSSVLLAAGASDSKVIKIATDLDSLNSIVAEVKQARDVLNNGDSESALRHLAKATVSANNFLLSHLKESELVGEVGGISEQIVDGLYGIFKVAIELNQFQSNDRDKLQHALILRLGEVNKALIAIDEEISKIPKNTTNDVTSKPLGERAILSSKRQITLDEFEVEIFRSLSRQETCCTIYDFNTAQEVFLEAKRQLAAGRKVVLDDGYVIGLSNLILSLRFNAKSELTKKESNGKIFSRETFEEDNKDILVGDTAAIWDYPFSPGDAAYGECRAILKKIGATTFTAHCESTSLTVTPITDVSLEIFDGRMQVREETRYKYGDTSVLQVTGTFREAKLISGSVNRKIN